MNDREAVTVIYSPLVWLFFFSSRRRHTRLVSDWSQTCALPIYANTKLNLRCARSIVWVFKEKYLLRLLTIFQFSAEIFICYSVAWLRLMPSRACCGIIVRSKKRVSGKRNNMKAQTLYDKLWNAHVVRQEADGTALIYIDRSE